MVHCVIWYHLYNLKNVENTHGGVLILVTFLKLTLLHGCFSRFLNCTKANKSRNASHLRNKAIPGLFYWKYFNNVSRYPAFEPHES